MVGFKLLTDFSGSQQFVLYLKMYAQEPLKVTSSAEDMSYLVYFTSCQKTHLEHTVFHLYSRRRSRRPNYLIKRNCIQLNKNYRTAVSLTGLFWGNSQVCNCITVTACFCHLFVTHVLNSVESLNLFLFCFGDWFLRAMQVCSFSAACSNPGREL